MAQEYPTSLGTSDADTITLLGQNLADDLMGKVGFGELTLWMVTQRRPTQSRGARLRVGARRARRPRLHADRDRRPADLPERPRLAAGRARGGPARRRLPVPRRDRGRRPVPRRGARRGGRDSRRRRRVRRARAGSRPAGAGGEEVRPRPRPPGAQGPRPAHPGAHRDRRRRGAARPAPATVRGDRPGPPAGPRPDAAAQRRGHLRRRARRPRPAAQAAARLRAARPRRGTPRPAGRGAAHADRERHLHARRPQRGLRNPQVRVHLRQGSRHGNRRSGHRLDPSPVLLPRQHLDRRRPAAVRRRVGRQDHRLPRDAHPGQPGRARPGGQRPLPPALAGQHAAVPRRQGAVLRRELVQRGARVRPAADVLHRAARTCPRTSCATASTRASTSRSATSCGSTTASPAR